jgi:hypothetical protein
MKSKILNSIIILFFISTLSLLCEYEKPNDPALAGTNYQLHKNWFVRLFSNETSSWGLEEIHVNGNGSFNWASWGCHNLGLECRRGDHCSRWSVFAMGEDWEPPLPQEQGDWQRVNYDEAPEHYDLINDTYY